jgi:uncharacterized Rmd1/YagE family protein
MFVHVDHTFGFIEADYGVLVRPTLPEWSEGGQDQITLRMLDTDNIRVISSILGQSIALDHYAKRVRTLFTKWIMLFLFCTMSCFLSLTHCC